MSCDKGVEAASTSGTDKTGASTGPLRARTTVLAGWALTGAMSAGAARDAAATACAMAVWPSGVVSRPAATGVAKAQAPAARRTAFVERDRGEVAGAVMIASTRAFRLEPA